MGGLWHKSPAHWLNYYCGISLGPAREKVRVALCLVNLPLIDATFQRERAGNQNEQISEAKDVPAGTSFAEESVEPEASDTFSQKRADAVVRMAEHYLATGKDGPVPLAGGDKTQIIVQLNAHSTPDDHQPAAWLDNGPVLSPATVKRLASDASLVTVLEDKDGNVLNVGRKTRTIPPSIRRALILRDQGCRFPGCCESKYVDAHHIHHWCDGGETSLDNLVLLCRKHHRLVHEDGYGIEKDDDGIPVFLTPAGWHMAKTLHPQFPEISKNVSADTFLAIEREHEELGLEIDADTAVTAWLGETMDYGMAVESLLNRNHQAH